MKTKILVLFTAILTLGSVSSCVAPHRSSSTFRSTDSIRLGLSRGPGPSHAAYHGSGLGGKLSRSMSRGPSASPRSTSLGSMGYRGGAASRGYSRF